MKPRHLSFPSAIERWTLMLCLLSPLHCAAEQYFRVVNSETMKPVPKARLTVIWTANFPDRTTNVVTTDGQGTCLLPIHRVEGREWGYSIEVFRDGYVPKYVSWSERQGDEPSDIPTEYTTKLTPAVNIGGVVVTELGEPVQDARVVFDVFGYQAPARSLDRERLTMNAHYHVEIADDQGRWHCSHVPTEFGMIRFKIAHPAYAPREFGSAALGPTTNHGVAFLAQAELRNETAVMPLVQGALAAGTVVDESDNPVVGAKVTVDHQWAEPTANQITG